MRCGVRAVLRILSCALGFGVVLGDTLVLDCIWDFGVGIRRCFVCWIVFGISASDLGGTLCIVVLERLKS